jgi:hypothetical protein
MHFRIFSFSADNPGAIFAWQLGSYYRRGLSRQAWPPQIGTRNPYGLLSIDTGSLALRAHPEKMVLELCFLLS